MFIRLIEKHPSITTSGLYCATYRSYFYRLLRVHWITAIHICVTLSLKLLHALKQKIRWKNGTSTFFSKNISILLVDFVSVLALQLPRRNINKIIGIKKYVQIARRKIFLSIHFGNRKCYKFIKLIRKTITSHLNHSGSIRVNIQNHTYDFSLPKFNFRHNFPKSETFLPVPLSL